MFVNCHSIYWNWVGGLDDHRLYHHHVFTCNDYSFFFILAIFQWFSKISFFVWIQKIDSYLSAIVINAEVTHLNVNIDGIKISLSHVDLARGMGQLRDYWRRSPFIGARSIWKRTISLCRALCVYIYKLYIWSYRLPIKFWLNGAIWFNRTRFGRL